MTFAKSSGASNTSNTRRAIILGVFRPRMRNIAAHSSSDNVMTKWSCGDRLGSSLGVRSNGMAGPPVAVNSVQPAMDGLQHARVSIFNHVLEVMPHGHQFLELRGGQTRIR